MAILTRRRSPAIGLGLAGALLCAQAGCSDRLHLNPLDPENPDTGGRPWNLSALAKERAVELEWANYQFDDLAGFELRRARGAEPESTIAELGVELGTYLDQNLADGVDYHYRLLPRLANGDSIRADGPVVATPGPQVAWAVDTGNGFVARLAPDGRAIAFRVRGFISPVAAAVSPLDHRLWVTDTFRGRVVAIDNEGKSTQVIEGFESPEAIAITQDGTVIWVADEVAGVVERFTPRGVSLGRTTDLAAPADLALTPDGSGWVIDSTNGSAVLFDPTLERQAKVEGFVTPLGVVAVPADTSAWVADFGGDQVVRVLKDGTLGVAIPVASPIGLALDSATQHLWIASFASGTVERYRIEGTTVEQIASATGFEGPIALAADPVDGGVWVADQRGDAVVKLTADGRERGRTQGYERLLDIVLDPAGGLVARGR
jgi:DNA-binding beta-propeller fold protein YncE